LKLHREDEAVSSTIATVLLFGGVVSIIGMMMASMMPVILEMQGSIERNDMAAQMGLLAQRADALAETGMPGDAAHVEIRPIDGQLRWDETASGMWYAATWAESHTLRSRGLRNQKQQRCVWTTFVWARTGPSTTPHPPGWNPWW
jgi:hypothetical protein